MLIFDSSHRGRYAKSQRLMNNDIPSHPLPSHCLRENPPKLPELSELQVVRHFTRLSQENFSVDTHFYPLGSCTMKYNPKAAHVAATAPGFLQRHPLAGLEHSQGFLRCAYELQSMLQAITGMDEVSLTPMAGAQGELAGVLMIRAYHRDRNDHHRTEMLVPDSAHGTNPATAVMCGYEVKEIPTSRNGDLDLNALQKHLGSKTAGIMLTNPSTLGLFERQILSIAEQVHQAGGLLYYDGANLNAIAGKVRPADMGFDVMHMNLHKTFATPHGGGGPGAGPVAANKRLAPYLPIPRVGMREKHYYWLTEHECPHTIGRLSTFMGNAGILLRAYIYLRMLGREGVERISEFATLNANYLMAELQKIGIELAYPKRRASHEFVITFTRQAKTWSVTARDLAKRLLDYGFHAPTTYFPLLIPECWLIEPTETETKETLDGFVSALASILKEAEVSPEIVQTAPHTLPVGRLDDIKAAKDLDVVYKMSVTP